MRIDEILTNAERVNKTWHDTIQESSRLQEALFFKPIPWKDIKYTEKSDNYESYGLGILAKNIPEYAGSNVPELLCGHNIVKNSLCRHVRESWEVLEHARLSSKVATLHRPDASWRRMFISQPPTQVPRSGTEPVTWLGDLEPTEDNTIFVLHDVFQMEHWRRVEYASELRDILEGTLEESELEFRLRKAEEERTRWLIEECR